MVVLAMIFGDWKIQDTSWQLLTQKIKKIIKKNTHLSRWSSRVLQNITSLFPFIRHLKIISSDQYSFWFVCFSFSTLKVPTSVDLHVMNDQGLVSAMNYDSFIHFWVTTTPFKFVWNVYTCINPLWCINWNSLWKIPGVLLGVITRL